MALILSLSGTITFVTDLGGGDTLTETYDYAPTTNTYTLTRETFSARAYYLSNETDVPTATKFWLLAKCCCWRCRFGIKPGFISPTPWNFPRQYTSVNTADHSGDVDVAQTVPFTLSWTDAFVNERSVFCRAGDESGREGLRAYLTAQLLTYSFSGINLDYSLTDSAGRSVTGDSAGTLGFLHPPTDSPANDPGFPMASCGDTISAWSQTVYNYSGAYGAQTLTISDLTIRTELSLT